MMHSTMRGVFLASSAMVVLAAMPAHAAGQTRQFAIEAQSATTAIGALGHQGDVQIIAPRKFTQSVRTNAVRGDMTVDEALGRMLAGTGLVAQQIGPHSYAITMRASAPALQPVHAVSVRPGPALITGERAAMTDAPSMPAEALSAPDEAPAADIIVKGFRRTLMKAQDIKRSAVNLTESIVAEDMAKMPDLNLSESIQRLPGVAITREGGEGRNITLRGFSPDFTRTTLNGMEVPASSDGLDSGGFTLNAGRAFDFHVFASELFNRIDVNKTQRASIEEGGIAGTVDLYSAKPFDFKGFHFVASGQGGYNSMTRKVDPRLTMMVSDTFADDRIGVLVSAAYSRRTVYQEGYSSVLWTSPYINGDSWANSNPTVTGTPAPCGAAKATDCLWAPRLPRADFFGNDQKRLGVTGSLQFKPTDRMLISFDVLYSQLDNDRYSYNSMEWLLTHGPAGNFVGQTPLSFTVAPDGKQLIAASFNDVTSWYESRHQTSLSKFQQYVLSGDYRFSDKLKFDAMAGTARDAADRSELRFYARSSPHFYSYDFTANPNVAKVSYGSYDPNNTANYINALTAANRLNNVVKDNFTAKANLTYTDNKFNAKIGAVFNRRMVRYGEAQGDLPSFAPSSYMQAFPIPHFGDGVVAGGLPTFAVMNFDAIARSGLISPNYVDNSSADWTVIEKTMGGYGEVNGEFDIGGMTLRANAGARYVRTNLISRAIISGAPVQVERSYGNFLPAANLVLNITPDLLARFSYARSMTRPGLSSLTISSPVFEYTTRTVGNLGNPDLKPYQSNDFDLNVEYYFGKGGLVALGVFKKDIVTSLTNSVVSKMVPQEFWAAIYADPRYSPSYQADPAKVPYTFATAINAPGGNSVKGLEATLNVPFTFLKGWMSYFGIASNYTYVSARDSTGLSPNSYNFTGYYDTGKLGVRVSINKRDDYLLSQPAGNGNVQERKYGPTQVDFSAYYNLTKRLSLNIQGINITNEKERIYDTGDGTQILPREYTKTGAQWFVGARYQF
ncbi:TonB-dependent receptor (plasmid) [Novosphingobium humi]|uniref:TonB-dependent receptor n=2 Tax=Novosphingobium humi TaxID=2282397 RepID=A0ABY7U570_9SPHN|nr:TonB-dependent receptor [Novosphingobium humi]WCT79524.1 TonB-dependent receptor [Novosphingobium humi]